MNQTVVPFPRSFRMSIVAMLLMLAFATSAFAQTRPGWRAASAEELQAALPSRAQVGKERIETELRTATGIVDSRGAVIAAVVLITAGYAADGKYSHYLLAQAPIAVADRRLAAGAYVVGWSHTENGLLVHLYDAISGLEKATVIAKPIVGSHRVEGFRIWPPAERSIIQIGRYMVPYSVEP